MTIIESRREANVVQFTADDKEYLVMAGSNHVTVIAGRWINDRRALGKTFHSIEELKANYKRHGAILADYAASMCQIPQTR